MSGMVEVIRKIVEAEIRKIYVTEVGVVTNVFPGPDDFYRCHVKLLSRGVADKGGEIELHDVPISTQQIGLVNIPNIDDLVLISFLNGDLQAPVIIGRLYNDKQKPPANEIDEFVYVAPEITGNDEKARRVYVEFPNGIKLTMTEDIVNLEAGKTILTINRDGNVEIECNEAISITATGDMTFKADNITLESEKGMEFKAEKTKMETKQDMEFKAGAKTTIKGETGVSMTSSTSMDFKGATGVKLESDTTVDIKAGATANIEATAPLTLKGAQVNIN
ncbi:MAG: phage baseplate assembly protein V [Candidatus Bathyarchaeota archaeon]